MNPKQLLQHFDRISEAPDAIPRLRRFILDLAVRGKLVEQDPNDEPAAELLKRIQIEKDRLGLTPRRKGAKKNEKADQETLGDLAAWREMPFAIPSTWIWTRLGEIGDWGSGSTPPRGNSEYYGDDMTWLKSGELGDSLSLVGSDERVTYLALEKCSFRLNKPGDVLIAMYGATIGKLAILAEQAVTNQAVCGCTPVTGIFNKYLFLFLLSRREDFHGQSEGGAQPNISKVKIVSSPFILPPLAEQHRIVAKVDELMALCDQLQAAQTEREQSRDRLVAASLHRIGDMTQSRHSGRVCPGQGLPGDCRTNPPGADLHPPEGCRAGQPGMNPEHRDVNLSDTPLLRFGSELQGAEVMEAKPVYVPVNWIPAIPRQSLTGAGSAGMTVTDSADFVMQHLPRLTTRPAHIKQLRQTILNLAVRGRLVPQDPDDEPAAELLKRIQAEKERQGLTPRRKGAKKSEKADQESLGDLAAWREMPFAPPNGWAWARLGQISLFVTSGSRDWAKYYSEEGAIFIRMGNLSKNHYRMRLAQIQRVKPPANGEGARTRLEPWDLLISITGDVGMLGLIPEGFGEAYINQHTAMVRPMKEMKGLYLAELFRSPFAHDQFNAPQRGIKNSFRLSDVTEFIVPLPPLAEQHRIVAKVDELMALCDQLETQLNTTEIDSRRLLEAVLHEALAPVLEEAA